MIGCSSFVATELFVKSSVIIIRWYCFVFPSMYIMWQYSKYLIICLAHKNIVFEHEYGNIWEKSVISLVLFLHVNLGGKTFKWIGSISSVICSFLLHILAKNCAQHVLYTGIPILLERTTRLLIYWMKTVKLWLLQWTFSNFPIWSLP